MTAPIKLSRLEKLFNVTDQEPLFYKVTLEEISRLCEALRIADACLSKEIEKCFACNDGTGVECTNPTCVRIKQTRTKINALVDLS